MEVHELLLTYSEIGFDRVYLRHRSKDRVRSNEVPDLHLRDAGNPSDELRDFGELHVEFSLFDVCLRRLHQGLRTEPRLDFRIKLALGDRARLRQGRVSLDIEVGFAKLRLCLRELRLRLVECGLKRARVDFEKDLSLSHHGPFFVVLLDDVPGNARLYLRVHVPVQRYHAFAVDWRVLLHDGGDFYDRWRRS